MPDGAEDIAVNKMVRFLISGYSLSLFPSHLQKGMMDDIDD